MLCLKFLTTLHQEKRLSGFNHAIANGLSTNSIEMGQAPSNLSISLSILTKLLCHLPLFMQDDAHFFYYPCSVGCLACSERCLCHAQQCSRDKKRQVLVVAEGGQITPRAPEEGGNTSPPKRMKWTGGFWFRHTMVI